MEGIINMPKCLKIKGRGVLQLLPFIFSISALLMFFSPALAAEIEYTYTLEHEDGTPVYEGLEEFEIPEGPSDTAGPVISGEFMLEDALELDADTVTFENAAGLVIAQGSVVANGRNMRLTAPRAVYDTQKGIITAYASDEEKIVFKAQDLLLTGESVEYDVDARAGILTSASGKMDAVFLRGGDATTMPLEAAMERGLISRRQRKATAASSENVVFWENGSATTCDFEEPHYKVVSKKAVIFPNRRAVLKRARLFMDNRMIFQYPFDYIIPLNKREDAWPLLPSIAYNSEFGLGISTKGPFTWDGGQLNVSAAYWFEGEWEAELDIWQRISGNVAVFASSKRLYNKDTQETLWRPRWGINYHNAGWSVTLLESQRELFVTELSTGRERRYDVWRSPEFSFSSPWFKFAPYHFFRLSGSWGQYQDNMSHTLARTKRILGNLQIYGEPDVGDFFFHPFYSASYRYFDYEDGDRTQKATDVTAGFRWQVGELKLATAYLRRWVDGRSPLAWDRYSDREDLYQQITYNFSGAKEWEKWQASVRAGYNLIDQALGEMVYAVSYNRHCMTWQLYVKDNRNDGDVSVGLRFLINAYPNQPLTLGDPQISNPFRRLVPQSRLSQ